MAFFPAVPQAGGVVKFGNNALAFSDKVYTRVFTNYFCDRIIRVYRALQLLTNLPKFKIATCSHGWHQM